jgi:predicted dehydrogenase
MRADDDLRVVVVGVGQIAESIHLPVLSALSGVSIRGVVDPRPERRDLVRARWPGVEAFGSIDELAGAAAPDALVVCTPPDHHEGPALCAFELGAHLYLEKPIAVSSEDARRIVEASEGSSRVAMLGFNYRFHPGVTELARRLATGEIGERVAIRTVFSVTALDPDDWRRVRARGGGALQDLGGHHIDLMRFITGEDATDVTASISSRQSEGDTALVTVGLSDGSFAQSLFAFGGPESDRFEVFGEKGSLALDRLKGEVEFHPPRFEYGRGAALRDAVRELAGTARRIVRAPGERSYHLALSAFVHAARARHGQDAGLGPGAHQLPTLEDGLRALECVEAAIESSATGSTVTVRPAGAGPFPRARS